MAVNALATAFAKIVPTLDTGAMKAELGKATAGTGAIGDGIGNNIKSGIMGKLGGIGGLIAGAVSIGAVTAFGSALIRAGEEEAKGNAIVAQHAKTMGLFGSETESVTKRILDLSGKLAMKNGVDDDSIKLAQSQILTFSEVAKSADTAGGVFDRTTQAAIDLAASGFGTVDSAAVQLGKALQDPANKLTALQKSGISFTEAEKEKIKALQESGDMLGAQTILLEAVEKQVGGTAAASAPASAKMKVAWDEVTDALGTALLPMFEKVVGYIISDIIPAIQSFIEEFKAGKTPLNGFLDAVTGIFNFIKDNWSWLSAVALAIGAVFIAYTVGMTALSIANAIASFSFATLSAAIAATGIGAIIIAVGLLIAGVIYLATQTTFFQDTWSAMCAGVNAALEATGQFFNTVFTAIGQWWTDMVNGIVAGFQAAVTWIGDLLNTVGGFFASVWNGIGEGFRGMVNWIISLYESMINFIIGGINNFLSLLNGGLGAIKDLTGLDLQIGSIPNVSLPRLAKGGIVMPSPGGTIAQIAEAGQPEAVIPLSKLDSMLSGGKGNGATFIYNAAENRSISKEQELLEAMKRGRIQGAY